MSMSRRAEEAENSMNLLGAQDQQRFESNYAVFERSTLGEVEEWITNTPVLPAEHTRALSRAQRVRKQVSKYQAGPASGKLHGKKPI